MDTNNEEMARTVAELVAQLARVTQDYVRGLSPAQWSVLRYLARANRFSRTVSAFAEYHATTRGTASQTVKSLVVMGYVKKTRCTDDGRSSVLDLTRAGRKLLAHDPRNALVSAAERIPPGLCAQTAKGLKRLVAGLEMDSNIRLFGTCRNCIHFENRKGEVETDQGQEDPLSACSLKGCALESEELDYVCVDFSTVKIPSR
jgi:DNA-binding MarR family transcriptional regulator